MRTKAMEIIIAILLGLLIPSLLVAILQDKVLEDSESNEVTQAESGNTTPENTIAVLQKDGTVVQMQVEEYVLSVVISEMPADFEIEALKAQAVVARTYALRRAEKNTKHSNAAVCCDSSCCQGYCSAENYYSKGGLKENVEKIRSAVESTSGLVLVYNGELIDATYFSCSGGITEDALAVWGSDIPYLRSVKSPGEEGATHFVDTIRLNVKEFGKKLGIEQADKSKIRIEKITHTNGGGVESIEICGKRYTGTEMRKLLKLRSTAFYISVLGDTVTITTKGFGHRVGMSQYGADAMAVSGSTFQQILSHYYQGTQLIPYDFN